MICPACHSEEQKVMSTRATTGKVMRLRCCGACGHRWNTTEVSSDALVRMEQAVQAVRSFATLSKELDNASAAHG